MLVRLGENVDGKKWIITFASISVTVFVSSLIGLLLPNPEGSLGVVATACRDTIPQSMDTGIRHNRWFKMRCPIRIKLNNPEFITQLDLSNMVLVAELPDEGFEFSRWQQTLAATLHISVIYKGPKVPEGVVQLTMDVRLAYSNKDISKQKTPWKMYSYSTEKRVLNCIRNDNVPNFLHKHGNRYDCSMVPLFELGILYHDFYLVNLRIKSNKTLTEHIQLFSIAELSLHVIFMNDVFVKIAVGLKSVFFCLAVGFLVWFWRRINNPDVQEWASLVLGVSLALLYLPIEFLSLFCSVPITFLLNDFRHDTFYAVIFVFWIILVGEGMSGLGEGETNRYNSYRSNVFIIRIICGFLMIFDFFEHIAELINPFFSIWATNTGASLALTFIISAGFLAVFYLGFLCYKLWDIYKSNKVKLSNSSGMSDNARLHLESTIAASNYLSILTVLCATLTVISFILYRVSSGENKWFTMHLETYTWFHTIVYSLWNGYICSILYLYVPRQGQQPAQQACADGEAIELSRLPPSAELSRLQPSAQLSRLPPSAELSRLPPSAQLSRLSPSAQLSRLPPSAELSRLPHSAELSRLQPSAQLSRLPPSAELSRLPHSAELSRLQPSVELSRLSPSAELSGLPPSAELSRLPRLPSPIFI